jgi:DNA polymerase-1
MTAERLDGIGPDGIGPDGIESGEPELRLFALPAAATALAPPPVAGGRGNGAARRGRRRPSPLLLAVDGTGLAHRVYHAVGGAEAPEEAPVERFVTVLCRLAGDARATACLVGFDDPVRSLRRDAEPVYKAQRPPKPDELVELLDRLPDLLMQLGLAVAVPPGLEADDVLGSAADTAERHRVAATLATGDRDAFSLVRPTVSVWYLGNGGSVERVSPSWLHARYGVKPAAYLDFAALRGDTSDNLPGIRGIGAMTAARLLAVYPTVEAALADPKGLARVLGPSLTHTLMEGRGVFLHNRDLMRIHTDVKIDLDGCNQALDRRSVAIGLRSVGLTDLTDRVLRSFSRLGQAAWRCAPPAAPVATAGTGDVLDRAAAVAPPVPAISTAPAATAEEATAEADPVVDAAAVPAIASPRPELAAGADAPPQPRRRRPRVATVRA